MKKLIAAILAVTILAFSFVFFTSCETKAEKEARVAQKNLEYAQERLNQAEKSKNRLEDMVDEYYKYHP